MARAFRAPVDSEEEQVGRDRVVRDGDDLVLHAPRMDGWRPSRHRPVAITFRGARYHLVAADADGATMRYRLRPAPPNDASLTSLEVAYDEAFVVARDETRDAIVQRTRAAYALLPIYPVLGFLWVNPRRALRERYGFGRRAAAFSLTLQSCVMLLLGTWSWTLLLPPATWGVSLLLGADLFARAASALRDDLVDPYGFFEWVFRRIDDDGVSRSRFSARGS